MNILKNSRFSVFCRTISSHLSSFKINAKLGDKNILFIWIPKTAGTTIFKSLENVLGMQKRKRQKEFLSFPNKGVVTFGHVSYLSLLTLGAVSQEYHLNSYKFCFVRNPYNRALSLFNYLIQEKTIDHKLEFEAFLDKIYLNRPPIGLYNSIGISQSNPQSDWIIGNNEKLLVDDIFKVEEIDKFNSFIEDKYKKRIDIKTMNESKKVISLEKILENRSILEKIELIYARDFDLLNYKRISRKK